MSVLILPLSEVSQRAKNALIQELGVIDTLRFLNQFRAGHGDYTIDREKLFQGKTVKSIMAEITAERSGEH